MPHDFHGSTLGGRYCRMAWLIAAVVGGSAACTVIDPVFICESDLQCNRPGGRCEVGGYCSFHDPDCDSGQRYGTLVIPALRDRCVDAVDPPTAGGARTQPPDEGSSDESGDDPKEGSGEETGDDSNDESPWAETDGDPTQGSSGGSWRCGDGVAGTGEACDGADLGGASCVSLGFDGGTLVCTAACEHDPSGCHACGDGTAQAPEACDGGDLGGSGCGDVGYVSGELSCAADCTLDTSSCDACGETAPAEGADACPSACDSCSGSTCNIDCSLGNSCSGESIDCPDGWDCSISCGDHGCSSSSIAGPAGGDLILSCNGSHACAMTDVSCPDDGVCAVVCSDEFSACANTLVSCGLQACSADCAGDTEPTLFGAASCSVTPC